MIGGYCLQSTPGQTQGQLAGQAVQFSINLAATATEAGVNICEGAGKSTEAPVNYAYRKAPERSQRRFEWLGYPLIDEPQTPV